VELRITINQIELVDNSIRLGTGLIYAVTPGYPMEHTSSTELLKLLAENIRHRELVVKVLEPEDGAGRQLAINGIQNEEGRDGVLYGAV
jgi:hypothetical protein